MPEQVTDSRGEPQPGELTGLGKIRMGQRAGLEERLRKGGRGSRGSMIISRSLQTAEGWRCKGRVPIHLRGKASGEEVGRSSAPDTGHDTVSWLPGPITNRQHNGHLASHSAGVGSQQPQQEADQPWHLSQETNTVPKRCSWPVVCMDQWTDREFGCFLLRSGPNALGP